MFARHVDLPRGPEREIVRERKRSCELNGRESAALSTIAAFRVVQVSDVREMLDDGRGGRSAQKESGTPSGVGPVGAYPPGAARRGRHGAHEPRSRSARSESS